MVDWLSYATPDPIPGVEPADYVSEERPTWKLLLHTTEGASYQVARRAYARNGFAPHITVGPDPEREDSVRAWQHLSLGARATTLADDPGGIRTNRDYVLQVEIVGFCDPERSSHRLFVHNWPAWYEQGVARVLRDMRAAKPVPRRSTVTWVRYPDSYGEDASQRLSAGEFDAYAGILGHQHAPENSHGDPGDLWAFVRDHLLHEEEDMPTFRHYGLREPVAVRPADGDGVYPRFLQWDTEWADPKPRAHHDGGASYVRRSDGWAVHELSGVRVEGMAVDDNYQIQIVIMDPEGEDVLWSAVVDEGRATSGKEFFSAHRMLRSRERQRVRWRLLYFGGERGVEITRADWIIREY